MAINTTFGAGAVLTAAQMNNLPFGVAGIQTLTSSFATAAPHTTFQDNGMTLTITEVSGRYYRITAFSNLVPTGGLQGIGLRIVRTAGSLKQGNYAPAVMQVDTSLPVVLSFTYLSVASGAATYKVQIGAITNNTTVNDYGDATFPRQFLIEDLGKT